MIIEAVLSHKVPLGNTFHLHCQHIAQLWVDASFATHHEIRIHIGDIMALGGIAEYSTSI